MSLMKQVWMPLKTYISWKMKCIFYMWRMFLCIVYPKSLSLTLYILKLLLYILKPSPLLYIMKLTDHISGWAQCSLDWNTTSFSKVLTVLMEDGSPSALSCCSRVKLCASPRNSKCWTLLPMPAACEDFRVIYPSTLQ